MKKIITILICAFALNQLLAQSFQGYYYANGKAQYWTDDSTSANIIVGNMQHYDKIIANLKSVFTDAKDKILSSDETDNIIINSIQLLQISKERLIAAIQAEEGDIVFFACSKLIGKEHIWLRNEVLVKYRPGRIPSIERLREQLSRYDLLSIEYNSDNEYSVYCKNEHDVVEIANMLYDTSIVEYSTPDFYGNITLYANDPLYPQQWGLNNTGQNGGTSNMDINAPEAWNFVNAVTGSTGNGVKVAVIDEGVEFHEDFYDGNGVCSILEGYTANGQGTGRPLEEHWHGQCCAGVIAAKHNSIGVAGVAPNSRIVPIRIFTGNADFWSNVDMFSFKRVANAITKSWQDFGSEILNNSWGSPVENDKLDNAIKKALTEGRNGKGCVVVFASGNYNGGVSYPATVDNNIIVVGAIDRCGIRSGHLDYVPNSCEPWSVDHGSCYGSQLDIVAPGTNIPTTDRMGNAGSNNTNYINFGGTSAACPHVAGVAALILSVNPNLTQKQVADIIESTAKKTGSYSYQTTAGRPNGTWHEEAGYGLVDAYAAVVKAFFGNHYLSGSSTVTPCETFTCTYHKDAMPDWVWMVWETSPHFEIVSGQGTQNVQIRVRHNISSSTSPYVKAKFYAWNGQQSNEIYSLAKNITITDVSYPYPPALTEDYSVVQSQTWNTPYQISDTLHIRWGAKLTITSTLYCSSTAPIIIHEGGELIIDGGTVTSLCGNAAWPGILVAGNPSLGSTDYIYNGRLTLSNSATIANALCGVTLNSESALYGGRISASNSRFVNNATAVAFAAPPSGGNIPYLGCLFSFCTFEVNSSYMADMPAFQAHARLHSVLGITFSACTFKNERAGDAGSGTGIEAVNAGFTVKGYCSNRYALLANGSCPEADLTRSLFQGFNRGISVTGTATNLTAKIDQATFINNLTGVYANAANNVLVLRSNFNLGKATQAIKKGVHLLNSTGFRVEENSFAGTLPNASGLYGLVVENSGSNNNEIYKNRFEYLTVGQQFIGTNRNEFIRGGVVSGLKSLCNIHANIALTDIEVITGLFNSINSSSGIAYYQDGYNAAAQMLGKAAGNSFSATATVNFNNNANPILYPYHAGTPNGFPTVSAHSITVMEATAANSCPSKITGLFPREQHAYIMDLHIGVKSAYNSILYNYNQLMDGGSTQALLDAVQGEWKDDVWKLRQELMKKSPYLSRDVLIEVAKENSLPQALYLELCLANPDATKDYSFLKFLQYEIPNPLPAWMISLIESSWSQKTLRTDMESALSATGSEKDFWLNLLISEAQQDSLQDRAEIRSLYMDRASYSDRLSVAEGYIEENNFDAALETVYDLTQAFPKLTAEQEKEISGFKDYIDYRNELYLNNQSIYGLDSIALVTLIDLASLSSGRGRVLAHNILCELYGVCLEDMLEKSLASRPAGGTGSARGAAGREDFSAVKVSPNPAREYCSFSWDFGTGVQEHHFQLKITDASGRVMLTQPLEGAQGQWVWDTRAVARGSYAYSVTNGSVQLGNGKIIVTN